VTYSIIRFYADRDRESEIIETGLSLEQAQEHCGREDTHGPGWFDGYTEERWRGDGYGCSGGCAHCCSMHPCDCWN